MVVIQEQVILFMVKVAEEDLEYFFNHREDREDHLVEAGKHQQVLVS